MNYRFLRDYPSCLCHDKSRLKVYSDAEKINFNSNDFDRRLHPPLRYEKIINFKYFIG